jgi:hypothetical protein
LNKTNTTQNIKNPTNQIPTTPACRGNEVSLSAGEREEEIKRLDVEFTYLMLRAMFCSEEEREKYIIPRAREILEQYEVLKGGDY